jgi:Porin subfamily
MRKIIVAAIVAVLPTSVAAAELPRKPTAAPRPVSGNPCAAYGAGYVRVEGSSTCIKIGGSVRVEGGGSR